MGSFHCPDFTLLAALLASVRDRRLQRGKTEMRRLRMQSGMRLQIKRIALIAFGIYVAWNAVWLCRGCIPPSISSYCLGIPCPTTGMTRSVLSLLNGNVEEFFLFNPFTLAYLSLLVVSIAIVLRCYMRGKDIVLPNFVARGWIIALALGWFAKFIIGNRYW
jgi:hypothetical protein